MFETILIDQNPHWHKHQPIIAVVRQQFVKLLQYLSLPHIIAITGVRRCGKSTLLKQLIDYLIVVEHISPDNIMFLNLEQPFLLPYADDIRHLEQMVQDYLSLKAPQGQIYILLDEIQFFANWPLFIKSYFESKKVKFIITGSNSSLLSSDMMTLLSGRALAIELYPLNFSEMILHELKLNTKDEIIAKRSEVIHRLRHYVEQGGFPELLSVKAPDLRADILNAYAKTIILQDIVPRLGMRKPEQLEKLFVYLITNIGALSSYHKLASYFSLSDKAIKDYIQAFHKAYLLFEVERFSFSLKLQDRSPKKVYAIDTGMANACGFRFSNNHGKLLENMVFLDALCRGYEVYYYKTAEQFEVDFVIKKDRTMQLLQVCWQIKDDLVLIRELRALSAALDELKLDKAYLVTFDEGFYSKAESDKRIEIIPAYQWLLRD